MDNYDKKEFYRKAIDHIDTALFAIENYCASTSPEDKRQFITDLNHFKSKYSASITAIQTEEEQEKLRRQEKDLQQVQDTGDSLFEKLRRQEKDLQQVQDTLFDDLE